MCVIVHQPVGQRLTRRDAMALWAQNPDGGGIAFPHGGRIVIHKAMTFKEWWSTYRRVTKAHPKATMMLHMRIATHGTIDIDNTHPFRVDDHTVMAHNGVIWNCRPPKDGKRSDTRIFVEDVLPLMPKGWLDNDYLATMVDAFIDSSKLMFLSVDPELNHSVYTFGRWEKYKGLWVSNTYGLYPKPLPTKPHSGYTLSEYTFGKANNKDAKPFTFEDVRQYEWTELKDGEWVQVELDDIKPDSEDDWLQELEDLRAEYDYGKGSL